MVKILNEPKKSDKPFKSAIYSPKKDSNNKVEGDPYGIASRLGAQISKGKSRIKKKANGQLVIVDSNWDDHPRSIR